LTHAKTNTVNYLFEIGGAPLTSTTDDTIGYFIGPEGGWDMKEVQEAEVSGVQVAALGTLTMRAETAAIIAAYELLK
jgi:16S rRNA (uracil1498-N3)-methyltransferase